MLASITLQSWSSRNIVRGVCAPSECRLPIDPPKANVVFPQRLLNKVKHSGPVAKYNTSNRGQLHSMRARNWCREDRYLLELILSSPSTDRVECSLARFRNKALILTEGRYSFEVPSWLGMGDTLKHLGQCACVDMLSLASSTAKQRAQMVCPHASSTGNASLSPSSGSAPQESHFCNPVVTNRQSTEPKSRSRHIRRALSWRRSSP